MFFHIYKLQLQYCVDRKTSFLKTNLNSSPWIYLLTICRNFRKLAKINIVKFGDLVQVFTKNLKLSTMTDLRPSMMSLNNVTTGQFRLKKAKNNKRSFVEKHRLYVWLLLLQPGLDTSGWHVRVTCCYRVGQRRGSVGANRNDMYKL